jgi:hypothetical protein
MPLALGRGRAEQQHRHRLGVAAVGGQQRAQVHVRQVVGIDDEDVVGVVGEAGGRCDGAGRAQQHGLVGLGGAKALAVALAEEVAHGPRQVMGVDQHVAHAGCGQRVEPVAQQGPATDVHHALGHGVGDGPQPRAQAAGQQQGPGPRRAGRRRPAHALATSRTTLSCAIWRLQ